MSVTAELETGRTYTLDEAFAYCANITTSHYENFPVASLFLPEEKRPYIQAIYAFSRIADDFADEQNRTQVERLLDLNHWEEQLDDCIHGRAHHPIFVALAETIRRIDIQVDPLRDLLKAFKQDVTVSRYTTYENLLEYCRNSANPVGRLVLAVFGYRNDTLFRLSDDICTALQLTNFWQDVAIDLQKDRCYIPVEDIQDNGYSLERWKKGVADEDFASLMKFEVERTRALFYRGAALPSNVERDLRLELKLVWFGGMRVLRKIERVKYDVLHRRPYLGAVDKFLVLSSGLLIGDLSRFRRKRELWDLT